MKPTNIVRVAIYSFIGGFILLLLVAMLKESYANDQASTYLLSWQEQAFESVPGATMVEPPSVGRISATFHMQDREGRYYDYVCGIHTNCEIRNPQG